MVQGETIFSNVWETLLDYEVSVSLEQPKIEGNSYIKGVYVEKEGTEVSY